MAHIASLLGSGEDTGVLDYVTRFLEGVAVLAGDRDLLEANRSLRQAHDSGQPVRSDLATLAGLLQDRLADRVAI
jgi:hypothetical protein